LLSVGERLTEKETTMNGQGHGELQDALISRGVWNPTREEFDAYKHREVVMAARNLQKVPDELRLSHQTLHSYHTTLLAVSALRTGAL
jgi:hypothetical protein